MMVGNSSIMLQRCANWSVGVEVKGLILQNPPKSCKTRVLFLHFHSPGWQVCICSTCHTQ